jgi:hypothetical protein
MEIAGSREFVEVTLPGAKSPEPVRFHVDTGGNTPGLMIERSVADRLGFASVDALPRSIRIGGRDVMLPKGARWTINDHDEFARATRKDFAVGQLGAGFLSRFVLCLDPAHARMGLGDPKEFDLDPAGAKWVPLLFMPGGSNRALYPFVHLLLRDHGAFSGGYGVLVDTGATTSMLDRNKIEYQHLTHPDWAFAIGAFGDADMIGGQFDEEVLRAPDVALNTVGDPSAYGLKERVSIDVGPATFVERPTGTWGHMFGEMRATMGSHGAIANDVLLRYRLVLDYPHARLFAEPADRKPDTGADSSRVGIAVRFGVDGCPEVRQVTSTNARDTRTKLRIGDVITNVDGLDACKMFHHELEAALAGPPGTKKMLRLQRGGTDTTVVVTTSDLLAPPP